MSKYADFCTDSSKFKSELQEWEGSILKEGSGGGRGVKSFKLRVRGVEKLL